MHHGNRIIKRKGIKHFIFGSCWVFQQDPFKMAFWQIYPSWLKSRKMNAYWERKVVEISAKISVQTLNEKVGTLVMGERAELWG